MGTDGTAATDELDNLPMRQTIQLEVTAKQLREMDIAAEARCLNLSQFMLRAALDAVADDAHWADTNASDAGDAPPAV